jgi:phosphotransferase system IIA component
MKVQITKNCYVEGKPAKVGDIVDTKFANLLVGSGKASFEIKEKKSKKAPMNKKVDSFETR